MATEVTSAAIVNSTLDNSPIGSVTPSTAEFLTPSAGDNSQNAATTAWCLLGFAILLSQNGYIKFPTWLGGLVIQWGLSTNPSGSDLIVDFPIEFPNNCFVVHLTTTDNSGGGAGDRITYVLLDTITQSEFTWSTNGTFSAGGAFWLAIGN